MNLNDLSDITAWGARWTMVLQVHDRLNHVMKDNLMRYCPKTSETAKGKKEKWCYQESNPGPPVGFLAALLFFLHLCHFKGLWTVAAKSIFH